MSTTAEETKQMKENDVAIAINKEPKIDHKQDNQSSYFKEFASKSIIIIGLTIIAIALIIISVQLSALLNTNESIPSNLYRAMVLQHSFVRQMNQLVQLHPHYQHLRLLLKYCHLSHKHV